jgi:hypothetical protein
MFLNSEFHHFCILLKPVLGGVNGNLHFPVPSMSRLNQTEPATFYNFAVLGFLWGFWFPLFYSLTIRFGPQKKRRPCIAKKLASVKEVLCEFFLKKICGTDVQISISKG